MDYGQFFAGSLIVFSLLEALNSIDEFGRSRCHLLFLFPSSNCIPICLTRFSAFCRSGVNHDQDEPLIDLSPCLFLKIRIQVTQIKNAEVLAKERPANERRTVIYLIQS